jgi:hypothetical protein
MRAMCIALLATALASCASVEASRQPVDVEMQNVALHLSGDVTLHVRHLRGHFVTTNRSGVPYLDDTSSYQVVVDAGEVAVDVASLNALLTRTLENGHSNVRKLRVSIDDKGQLKQTGTIDKAIDLPFSSRGELSVTPDGRIRLHTRAVRGYGVPMTPLLKLFGVRMDDLIKVPSDRGISADGDDLLLDPSKLLPAPAIRGRITTVRLEGQALVETFGNGNPRPLSPPAVARNFIYWRGGQLSFGKLTMSDTDLELVDNDPHDPFDFSVEHWNDQLVAGYSKTTTRHGLKAVVPDYNDLPRPRPSHR